MRVLDLFSGIGGFSLGLERTGGFRTIAFCEIDHFCRKVLAKHWPGVPCFEDITKLGREELDGLGKVDVICGGFPCQDISCAGKGAGIHAARSGLWWEMLRIIRLVRPRFVLVENVAALLNRGLDEVLGSLAESGYDAEWQILRACDFGLPHRRERLFVVSYPDSDGFENESCSIAGGCAEKRHFFARGRRKFQIERLGERIQPGIYQGWDSRPAPSGMDDVVSVRLDRLRALGNAIVPQCSQYVGECVLDFEEVNHDIH